MTRRHIRYAAFAVVAVLCVLSTSPDYLRFGLLAVWAGIEAHLTIRRHGFRIGTVWSRDRDY